MQTCGCRPSSPDRGERRSTRSTITAHAPMQATRFSDTELAELHAHGIVLFADRVIFDAQSPMATDQIAAVQACCHGDIPLPLLELWRVTAGGSLDYDLTLEMNGNVEAISWSELFYNGSDGYRDLQGWIDHELELAEEAAQENARTWNGKIDALPFGGFEYCDRICVVTEPGAPDYGHVLAWKQGLPPAWRGAMHEDGLATIAPDLYAAFGALQLHVDPLEPGGEPGTGVTLLEYVDKRRDDHGLSASLADKLIAFYRQAVIDWRTPLADGTLGAQPVLARHALRHAIDRDDAALIARLAPLVADLGAALAGSSIPTDYALRRKKFSAAAALLASGAAVVPDALASVSGAVPATLIRMLLDAGAQPDADAMARCVAGGGADSARLIGAALSAHGVDTATAYRIASEKLLDKLQADIRKVRAGKLTHYLGLDGLEAHAERLRTFDY
ncbi:SMI1/KNR4 family protein [Burkholderia cenocepacia]|uniref:SMI1/KNR4 family protein n=2 Tax=Burkholderia cenocepacia TaxID=95486 RepID=A0A3Q9F588_9BURK|nr:SMI1/KNR4 family protein [Burkholderia cenocepacia]